MRLRAGRSRSRTADSRARLRRVLRLDELARLTENPCDGDAARQRVFLLHQRTVFERGAVQAVCFHETAHPVVLETFAQRADELHTRIAAARIESRPRRCRKLWRDTVE